MLIAPQYPLKRRLTMKGQKAIIVLLAVMLFFGIASSALGAASFAEIRNMKAEQEAEEETKEDGVEIAGGYTIESTLPISDAYKSGDRSALTDKQKETLDLACGKISSVNDEANVYPQFNDSRDLKRLKRNYIPDLEQWLETNTPTAEQQALIDRNNQAVNEMAERTVNDRENDDKIMDEYYDMLVTLGVYDKPEEESESFGTKLLKGMNDTTYKIFGAKGFRDKLFSF